MCETRLADPRRAEHREQRASAFRRHDLPHAAQRSKLFAATDDRHLGEDTLPRRNQRRDGDPGGHRVDLALGRDRLGFPVLDDGSGGGIRLLPDQDIRFLLDANDLEVLTNEIAPEERDLERYLDLVGLEGDERRRVCGMAPGAVYEVEIGWYVARKRGGLS